ncbi:MAG: reverse transcriptase/maturase family protein [Patescibacteria group bacterium]|jgi:retron-type reverse transcriptase
MNCWRSNHRSKNKKLKIKSFTEIISPENLFLAWQEFKVDKKKKIDVQEFELNLEDNLFRLHYDLKNGIYHHSDYTSFFVHDPKLRHIHKAAVRDRVLHHAVTRALEPTFERSFIFDSYSSRLNKGTHRAIKRFRGFARKLSRNNTKTVWILKGDIRKYFASIKHEILLDFIEKKIKEEKLLNLIRQIIFSYQNQPGRGIPLGNLTSQLFSNIYLNELDQFIKRKLGVKYYIRYADDFVIVDCDQIKLKNILKQIDDFLKEKLELEIHPAKTFFRKWHQGFDFLGYVIFPCYLILRIKTKRRMFWRIKEKNLACLAGKISQKKANQTLQSYLGLLSHANGHRIELKLNKDYEFRGGD